MMYRSDIFDGIVELQKELDTIASRIDGVPIYFTVKRLMSARDMLQKMIESASDEDNEL